MPIVREPDGLAMSSRNQRLSAAERQSATVLYACLKQTREGLLDGKSLQALVIEARSMCTSQGVNLEYLALADRKEFRLLDNVSDPRRAVILIAAQVGPVRLIDNLFIEP